MTELTLKDANTIIEAACHEGQSRGLAPLTVVVLDSGGHIKAISRADGASFMRPQIALAKAWGAIGMGVSSSALFEMSQSRPMFMNALINIADQKLMPVAGGVLVQNQAGSTIGAVGVSGDLSEQDEHCAIAGVKAAGFHASIEKS